jgi:hypothetical protein
MSSAGNTVLIDGRWVAPRSGARFDVVDSST